MRKRIKYYNELFEPEVNHNRDRLSLRVGDRNYELEINDRNNYHYLLAMGNRLIQAYAHREKDTIYVQIDGDAWVFYDITGEEGSSGSQLLEGDAQVVSPMPGSVIKVLVKEGDQVTRNQPLVIVEAMKMENEVRASLNAKVKKILVEAGQQVGAGEELIELELAPETDVL